MKINIRKQLLGLFNLNFGDNSWKLTGSWPTTTGVNIFFLEEDKSECGSCRIIWDWGAEWKWYHLLLLGSPKPLKIPRLLWPTSVHLFIWFSSQCFCLLLFTFLYSPITRRKIPPRILALPLLGPSELLHSMALYTNGPGQSFPIDKNGKQSC